MHRVLVQKPGVGKLFGGTLSRRVDESKMYLECTDWERVEWFYLLQVREKWCA
jgi:hypothetical protein